MGSKVIVIVPKNPEDGMWGISRKTLAESMEKNFGPVLYCKKPPSSGNPAEDIAFVQFKDQDAAERAVKSLEGGIPLQGAAGMSLYGCEVTGHFKGGGKDSGKGQNWNPEIKDSRALMAGKSSRRSRSRSRGRRDSRDRGNRRDYDDRYDARGRRTPPRDYAPRDRRDQGYKERQRDDSRARGRGSDARGGRQDDRGYNDRRRSPERDARRKDSRDRGARSAYSPPERQAREIEYQYDANANRGYKSPPRR